MSDDRVIGLIWLAGAMVMVGSALVVRRRDKRLVPAALLWIVIFALLFAVAHAIDSAR